MVEWLRVIDEVGDSVFVDPEHYTAIQAGMLSKHRALEVTCPVGIRMLLDCRRLAVVRHESISKAKAWAEWRTWVNERLPKYEDEDRNDWGPGA